MTADNDNLYSATVCRKHLFEHPVQFFLQLIDMRVHLRAVIADEGQKGFNVAAYPGLPHANGVGDIHDS
jgi:hypothetical protein